MSVTYSIIIPVYNSADSVNELLTGIERTMCNESYEIILVDDGSRDQSWERIAAYKENGGQQIRAIRLSRNFGQHNAVLCGLNYCGGEMIITMDDDLQHPPGEIHKLISRAKESDCDVVYGTFADKQHNILRNVGSGFVKRTSKYTADRTGEGSSFRLIRRHIIDKIKLNHQQNFLFIDEILQWYTTNIELVPVTHAPRKYGKSSYSFVKLVRLYFNILVNYSAVPLKLMTWSGLVFSLITFGIGTWMFIRKFIHHVPLGYTSLIVSILFTASIILLCLGVIGQYIFKLYVFQHRKPPYSVRKVM